MVTPLQRALLQANKIVKWATIFGAALSILWMHNLYAVWTVAGAVGAAIVAKTLKVLLNEERPSDLKKTAGMPSSHSCVLFFFAVYLYPLLSPLVGLAALTVAAGTAWSRVFLRFHTWPQVLVGAALGTLMAICWFRLSFLVSSPSLLLATV